MDGFAELPWDRQPGESIPAFEAFRAYREAGEARSLRQVARELRKSPSLIFRWSSSHAWVARALAWDIDQDALAAESDPKVRLARLVRIQRSLEIAAIALGGVAMEMIRREEEDPDFLASLSFRELNRLVQQAARVMPALVRAEHAVTEDERAHAADAARAETERSRRWAASLTQEQRETYLREAGLGEALGISA
jgi:hypothetical protein